MDSNVYSMKKTNYKRWSIALFTVFLLLFFLLAFFKSDITTWIWQLALPVLLIAQVIVILKAKDEGKKDFDNAWYDRK